MGVERNGWGVNRISRRGGVNRITHLFTLSRPRHFRTHFSPLLSMSALSSFFDLNLWISYRVCVYFLNSFFLLRFWLWIKPASSSSSTFIFSHLLFSFSFLLLVCTDFDILLKTVFS